MKVKGESEYKNADNPSLNESENGSISANGFRYGFVAGYKQFFTPEFGVRYYTSVDLGADYKKKMDNGSTMKITTYNISANADALYNFVSSSDYDFGVFLGLGFGYTNHKIRIDSAIEPSGFDLGVNFGFRTHIAQNHGVELYTHFGVLQQKEEIKSTFDNSSLISVFKAQQPYQIGLRYVFSF